MVRINGVMRSLRSDVKQFLASIPFITIKDNPWLYYSGLKQGLSKVCGWDAPTDKYDPVLFDKALMMLVRKLGI